MNNSQMEKMILLKKISQCEFMMIDLGLFLDTHPNCTEALENFRIHKKSYDRLVEEYERVYGPLTLYSVESEKYWTWISLPWPWEMEGC